MPTHRTRSGGTAVHPSLTPPVLAGWLSPFRACFSAPVWSRVLVLVAGAVLAPGKRTVTQTLRVMGLAANPGFSRYHEVLNRARWNSRAVARVLLVRVLDAFLPSGDVVLGVDDTIERRWDLKIKARGLYRDPVRSSRGHFVRASGLRWLSLMVMVPIPWAGRRWALVRQARADLQRRHRRGPPRALVPTGFIHVPPEHGDRRNLLRPSATAYGHPLLRSLKCGKSS